MAPTVPNVILSYRIPPTDTVTLYEVIRQRILSEFGKVYDFTTNIDSQGLLSRDAAAFVISKFDLPITVNEYLARSAAVGNKVFSNVQLMPGWLQDLGCPSFRSFINTLTVFM